MRLTPDTPHARRAQNLRERLKKVFDRMDEPAGRASKSSVFGNTVMSLARDAGLRIPKQGSDIGKACRRLLYGDGKETKAGFHTATEWMLDLIELGLLHFEQEFLLEAKPYRRLTEPTVPPPKPEDALRSVMPPVDLEAVRRDRLAEGYEGYSSESPEAVWGDTEAPVGSYGDPELDAMASVSQAMEPLDVNARQRVLDWARARWEES